MHVGRREGGGASMVAQLSDGQERAGGEGGENMAHAGRCWKMGKVEFARVGGGDSVAVGQ